MTATWLTKVCKRHQEMVCDPLRTPRLKQAIEAIVKPGDVVLDLGSGLGILSFFAVKGGAKTVYAIDPDKDAMRAARHFAKTVLSPDEARRVHFLDGLSYDVALPEKVDVIVCEIIGSLAFEENFLATLDDAKRRFLKPGGTIIPERVALWAALTNDDAACEGFENVGGLNLKGAVAPLRDWKALTVNPAHLVSEPVQMISLETMSSFPTSLHLKEKITLQKAGHVGGLTLWPEVTWAVQLETNASPFCETTHWKQGMLPLTPDSYQAGDCVLIELLIHPDCDSPQTRTEILWKAERVG